jgi:hypothetical protein
LLRPRLSRGLALRRGSALGSAFGPAFGSAFGSCRLPGGHSAARRRRRFAGINLRDKLERLADRLVLGERNVGAKDGRHNARCRNHGAGDAITKHVASLRYSTARANPSGPERNDLKVTQMRSFWRKARTKIRVVNTLRFPPRFLAAALLKASLARFTSQWVWRVPAWFPTFSGRSAAARSRQSELAIYRRFGHTFHKAGTAGVCCRVRCLTV